MQAPIADEELRFLVERMNQLLAVTDMAGNYLYANAAHKEILGYEPEELLGTCSLDLIHPEDVKALSEAFGRTGEQPDFFEYRHRCKDGSYRWLELHGDVVTNDKGDPQKAFVVGNDITQRKEAAARLRESEERFRLITENSTDVLWVMDTNMRQIYVSPSVIHQRGYTPEEAMAQSQEEMLTPEARELANEAYGKALRAEEKGLRDQNASLTLEMEMFCKDGSTIWTEVTSTFLHDAQGKMYGIHGITREITERKKAETRLRESEEQYRLIAENTADVIWITDMNLRLTYINPSVIRQRGYTPEEAMAQSPEEMLAPEALELATHEILKALDAEEKGERDPLEPVTLEMEMLCKDGATIWTEVTATFLHDGKGKPCGIHGIGREITERKEDEEQGSMVLLLAEASGQGIGMADVNGDIIYANPTLCRFLGEDTPEDALGKNVGDYYPEEDLPRLQNEILPAVFETGARTEEIDLLSKSGVLTNAIQNVFLIQNKQGQPLCIANVVTDITDRKKMEKELRESRQEAEEASRTKSQFLANMSHEIRTPMNGVLGITRLLLGTELTLQQREHAERVLISAEGLLSVINDILDFSKIEADKLELESINFDLRLMAEDFTDTLALRAQQKGLEFTCVIPHEIPALVRGDPGRLRQILINLAGNAIKFTEEGEVAIHVTVQEEDGQEATVRFSVSDTGIGIPQDRLSSLFASFSQLDTTTARKYGGTGLGLAISKKLAKMMGGQIGVESRQGQGSTFWFTAVLEKQGGDHKIPNPVPGEISNKHILVVDDNATSRHMLGEQLMTGGYRLAEAENGPEALEKLGQALATEDPFNIVLVDMFMPGMDGKTLGAKIKQDPRLEKTFLVMMTAVGFRGEAAQLRQLGFASYLTKPVKRSQLFECLAMITGLQTETRDLSYPSFVTRHTLAENRKHGIRILVVDDEETNRIVALGTLEQLGLKGDAVGSGKEALEALERLPYDLVLMDVQMPEMDGFEATSLIRDPQSLVRNHQVPIVAMTAHAMKKDRRRCLEAGMDDYVSKPFELQALVDVIERHISGSVQKVEPELDSKVMITIRDEQVFDYLALLKRLGQKEGLLKRVVETYMRSIPDQLEQLKQALNNQDARDVAARAHGIKGASANIEAPAMGAAALEIEKAGEQGDLDRALPLLGELEEELERLTSVFYESNLI